MILRRRCAFTLIELLVAIAVMAVLAALILAARPGLAGRKAANLKLANQVADAVTAYLQRYPLLDDSFARDPYRHLHDLPLASGEGAFIELPLSRLAVRAPDGTLRAAQIPGEGTVIRDFATEVSELRIWIPKPRATRNSRPLTHAIALWTDGGTPSIRDDVYYAFIINEAQWLQLDGAGFAAFKQEQGP